MAREKPYFRETVQLIREELGDKTILGVNDIKKYLRCGYNKAVEYLDGEKTITIFQFAAKLL